MPRKGDAMGDQHDAVDFGNNPAGKPDGGDNKSLSRKARLIIGIAAAVVLAVAGVAAPMLLDTGKPAALTITVFSSGAAEVMLKPGVEIKLNAFLASGSEVPGYPLRVGADGADTVSVSVDGGSLFTRSAPDDATTDRGSSWEIAPGDTIFWSPYARSDEKTEDNLVPQCTVTITARRNGTDVAQARLIVRQTGESAYSITLLASE
jgi:hypothetical protein